MFPMMAFHHAVGTEDYGAVIQDTRPSVPFSKARADINAESPAYL
jgi:hypothetical protein